MESINNNQGTNKLEIIKLKLEKTAKKIKENAPSVIDNIKEKTKEVASNIKEGVIDGAKIGQEKIEESVNAIQKKSKNTWQLIKSHRLFTIACVSSGVVLSWGLNKIFSYFNKRSINLSGNKELSLTAVEVEDN